MAGTGIGIGTCGWVCLLLCNAAERTSTDPKPREQVPERLRGNRERGIEVAVGELEADDSNTSSEEAGEDSNSDSN